MQLSFFRLDGDALVPSPLACSSWSDDQMHGVALSGALARGAERLLAERGRADLRASRFTVDLFRPAAMAPSVVTARVVRESPRLCLVDVELTQDGEPVTRASALFLRPTESGAGEVWSPAERPAAPTAAEVPPADQPRPPYLRSSEGWSQDFAAHQNAARKQSWSAVVDVVEGEAVSPFQAAAAGADAASLVTNWGTRGVEYINTDLTLTLARLPEGRELGLAAVDRVEQEGIAVGTAAMFDRSGPLGTVVLTALVNARRAIDFESVRYGDDGRRTAGSR